MVVNLDRLFTKCAKSLKASEIRELLKVTQIPGVISLGGGLPNPKAFPVEAIHQCIENVFDNHIMNALQYGTTEGLSLLRDELAKRMKEKKKINCEPHEILITSGAQQALSFIAFTFLEPGDTYIASAPTYLGALQAFSAFGGNCESIPLTNDGLDIDSLQRNIKRLLNTGIVPKFIYTVPTYQNPAGVTMPLKRRKELLEVASEFDLLIVEDDPYSDLIFEGKPIPPIKSLDTKGRVIYISTFSKILAPGFRLGWVIASNDIINKFVLRKQSADLCTNVFSQYVAYEYIAGGYLNQQVEKIKKLYKHKRDVMLKALKEFFPKDVKWTVPTGGMFLWVTLPKKINTRNLFQKALTKKVAYVVGDAFYAEGREYDSMRLNFSYTDDDEIREGIKRLSEVIKEEMTEIEKLEPLPEVI